MVERRGDGGRPDKTTIGPRRLSRRTVLFFSYWHDAGIWVRTLATVSSSVLHDTMYGSRALGASEAHVSALKVQSAPALMVLQHSFALAHTAQSATSAGSGPVFGDVPAEPPVPEPPPG